MNRVSPSRSLELSLVIPAYNERDNLAPLLMEIGVALAGHARDVGLTLGAVSELAECVMFTWFAPSVVRMV